MCCKNIHLRTRLNFITRRVATVWLSKVVAQILQDTYSGFYNYAWYLAITTITTINRNHQCSHAECKLDRMYTFSIRWSIDFYASWKPNKFVGRGGDLFCWGQWDISPPLPLAAWWQCGEGGDECSDSSRSEKDRQWEVPVPGREPVRNEGIQSSRAMCG